MDAFWHLARHLLRFKGSMGAAMAFAVIASACIGVGLVAALPILRALLSREDATLAGMIREAAGKFGLAPPESWLDALPTGTYEAIVWVVVGLGILTLVGGVCNFLHGYLSLTVVWRTITRIRMAAFRRVLRAPLKVMSGTGAIDPVSRVVNDTGILAAGFDALLSRGVLQSLKGLAALGAALVLDWRLTTVALVVALPVYVAIRKLSKRIRRASRSALQHQSRLLGAATEAMQGLRVVKAFAAEHREAARFARVNRDVMRQMMTMRTARVLSSPVVEVLSLAVLGALALVASKAIIDRRIDPADFLLTLAALFAAGASLKPLTGVLNELHLAAGGASRVREVLDAPVEPGHERGLPRLPRHRRSIEIENVAFTYPGASTPAIRGVSVRIDHAQLVAFVGPNGCGKTTLLSLVARLMDPDEGCVRIDGVDARSVGVRSLRRQIGFVTQETTLFSGTIRSNIAYASPRASEGAIIDAARRARAWDFIASLPRGLDTPVAEQGLTLSGGQRQRLAIARAILRDPAILLMDEATSMIDAESEARITEALAEFRRSRTCLVVAHRLSTVIAADAIVVMDAGRVVDRGTHAELLARCDVYQQLARHQLAGEPAAVAAANG